MRLIVKAEAGAVVRVWRVPGALERAENALQIVGRDARPGVRNVDSRYLAGVPDADSDFPREVSFTALPIRLISTCRTRF